MRKKLLNKQIKIIIISPLQLPFMNSLNELLADGMEYNQYWKSVVILKK